MRSERILAGLAVGCLAVFVLVAALVWHRHGPVALDGTLAGGALQLETLADLGSLQFVFSALALLAAAAYVLGRDTVAALVCLVGPAVAGLFELVAKHVVGRMKGTALSYPSGHTTLATALAVAVVYIAYRLAGGRAAALALVPATALSAAVSVAVVGAGWHYPTDAVGGVAVGLGFVCATAIAANRGADKLVPKRTN